jgi:rhodanese-related sulfurtransferase
VRRPASLRRGQGPTRRLRLSLLHEPEAAKRHPAGGRADELCSRQGELPHGREIAVYCQVGQRGYLATRILRQTGFVAVNVGGGYKTYQLWRPNANGLPAGEAAALHAANVG